MKVRVTLLTENDKPVSALGDNPEEKVKKAWESIIAMIMLLDGKGRDKATVEKVEVSD